MSSREQILGTVRAALKRKVGDPVPPPPPVWLADDPAPASELTARFTKALETLAGRVTLAATKDEVKTAVEAALAGRSAIAAIAHALDVLMVQLITAGALPTSWLPVPHVSLAPVLVLTLNSCV